MNIPEYTFIYALVDPRTGDVRYIGKADNLKSRLHHHVICRKNDPNRAKREWLQDLWEQNLSPQIRAIMKVPHDRWRDFERSAIEAYQNSGAVLLNRTNGGEGFNWAEAGRSEERSEITRRLWTDPSYREKQKMVNRKREISPDEHARRSKGMRRKWQEQEYRKIKTDRRRTQSSPSPEVREKISATLRKLWSNPEFRQASIEASQNPQSRKRRSRSMKNTLRKKRSG